MSTENILFIAFAIAAMIGGRFLINAIKKSQNKEADYKDMAQAFGWTYVRDTTSKRSAIFDIFSDPDDDWTLTIVFINSGPNGSNSIRRVDWTTPQGALAEGEAVLGAPLPEKTVDVLASGSKFAKTATKAALKGTMYALGKTKFTLAFDETTAGDPGGIVMSTPGQEKEMDSLRQNKALAAFREDRPDIDVPLMIRDENGLTLRRPNITSDRYELKAIVGLGKELRADLQQPVHIEPI
ncbi:MAG: hypothetical protein ACFBZ9_10745 [Sphingomonadales bacterium]